jgi:hypothetical protein
MWFADEKSKDTPEKMKRYLVMRSARIEGIGFEIIVVDCIGRRYQMEASTAADAQSWRTILACATIDPEQTKIFAGSCKPSTVSSPTN